MTTGQAMKAVKFMTTGQSLCLVNYDKEKHVTSMVSQLIAFSFVIVGFSNILNTKNWPGFTCEHFVKYQGLSFSYISSNEVCVTCMAGEVPLLVYKLICYYILLFLDPHRGCCCRCQSHIVICTYIHTKWLQQLLSRFVFNSVSSCSCS